MTDPLCNRCLEPIDPALGFYAKEFNWSKVGEFFLCNICIDEILSNWMYAKLNAEGKFL